MSSQTLFNLFLERIICDALGGHKGSFTTADLVFTNFRLADDMSRVMRKPDFCLCENKDADQLRGDREADQRLCFRYTDSTIRILPKSEISIF